jgi:hypothetical protein
MEDFFLGGVRIAGVPEVLNAIDDGNNGVTNSGIVELAWTSETELEVVAVSGDMREGDAICGVCGTNSLP